MSKPTKSGSGSVKEAQAGAKKTTVDKVLEAEKRLAQLKAKAALEKRRKKTRETAAKKKEQFQSALALSRQADAHRKIELGGVVIAAGADKLDPAVLCGLLLVATQGMTKERSEQLREMGLNHFEKRKAKREGSKS